MGVEGHVTCRRELVPELVGVNGTSRPSLRDSNEQVCLVDSCPTSRFDIGSVTYLLGLAIFEEELRRLAVVLSSSRMYFPRSGGSSLSVTHFDGQPPPLVRREVGLRMILSEGHVWGSCRLVCH